jgi:CCR4-NOT transcription complex subunit 2
MRPGYSAVAAGGGGGNDVLAALLGKAAAGMMLPGGGGPASGSSTSGYGGSGAEDGAGGGDHGGGGAAMLGLLTRGLLGPGGGGGGSALFPGGTGQSSVGGGVSGGLATTSPETYGILGLLSVIRSSDRDMGMLALGADLTSLGLDLNSPDPLNASFAHPWGERPVTSGEPAFNVPACYREPHPALKTGHFSKFDVQTLFYIFYAMPRDILQAYAAQELHAREWRYHRDHKAWFKLQAGGAPGGAAGGKVGGPPAGGAQQWVYWDLGAWESRPYSGPTQALVAGFLAEEEVRVRLPTSAAPGGSA